MIYQVRHVTRYSYSLPVASTHSELRLTPRELPWQHLVRSVIKLDPQQETMRGFRDYYGNGVRYCSVLTPHHELEIAAESIVEVQETNPIMPQATLPWEEVRAGLRAFDDRDADFFLSLVPGPRDRRWRILLRPIRLTYVKSPPLLQVQSTLQ